MMIATTAPTNKVTGSVAKITAQSSNRFQSGDPVTRTLPV
jgi:hypothetical protein